VVKGPPPGWPAAEIDLLLQALYLPAPRARQAWARWSETRSFDAATFGEARLLGALSRRLQELAPESPHLARLRGIARADWTRTQVTLEASLPAIDLLRERKIPFLLFGAASEHAAGRGRDRLLTQLDVLVPATYRPAAVETLTHGAWQGLSPLPAARASSHATVALHDEPHGRVALRASALPPFYGTAAQDRDLWTSAIETELGGRRVSVPSPEHGTLLSLGWGAREDGGSWGLELGRRLAEAPPDWSEVVDAARRWRLVTATLGGLRYLHRSLELPVPPSCLHSLEETATRWSERISYRSHLGGRSATAPSRRLVAHFADRLLRLQNGN